MDPNPSRPQHPSPPRRAETRRRASAPARTQTDGYGRYVVVRELAIGGMSRIFEAQDPLAGRRVAIKTLRWEYVTADNLAPCLARLDRQALLGGRLGHPHVVKVFDRGRDFLVLEHLEGLKLSTILRDRGHLELDEALRLLAPLASAIDHMHARGVVHRDIRPANVIVLADGSPKLMDFAAACEADAPGESWDGALGTPTHMAPEQVLHGTANALSDLFSFGVLAYELLTGQAPFRGDTVGAITYRVVYEEAPPPSRWIPALPAAYDDIFARVLSKDPGERLASAGAFARALRSSGERRRTPRTDTLDALRDEQARDLLRLQEPLLRRQSDTCVVEVQSAPEGAEVSWNGVRRGISPLRICEGGPGPHVLRLELEGHAPVEAAFMLPEAPSLRLQFTLVPAPPGKVLEFRQRRD